MKKRAVMDDVARRAGVSTQTVSRVVNNHPAVRQVTRERVHAAMRELNYQPNYAAQALASGQSRAIGVLTVGHLQHGLMTVFSKLQAIARRQGLYILATATSEENEAEMVNALDYLKSSQVRATVLFCQNNDAVSLLAQRELFPAVHLSSGRGQFAGISTIGIDQQPGVEQSLDHLWGQGVLDTVHIAGDLSYIDGANRAAAYRQYCRLSNKPSLTLGGRGWGCMDGYLVGQGLVERGIPEAILAGNDELAIGCMRALAERGAFAGRDYRIIGFDDNPSAAFLNPSLSSVRQHFSHLAAVILDEVNALTAGQQASVRHLPSELIVRESSVFSGSSGVIVP